MVRGNDSNRIVAQIKVAVILEKGYDNDFNTKFIFKINKLLCQNYMLLILVVIGEFFGGGMHEY